MLLARVEVAAVVPELGRSAVRAVEARLNRWTSTRQLGKGADTMHLALDRWVGSFPRAAGWTLALGSAIVLIASMIVWIGRH